MKQFSVKIDDAVDRIADKAALCNGSDSGHSCEGAEPISSYMPASKTLFVGDVHAGERLDAFISSAMPETVDRHGLNRNGGNRRPYPSGISSAYSRETSAPSRVERLNAARDCVRARAVDASCQSGVPAAASNPPLVRESAQDLDRSVLRGAAAADAAVTALSRGFLNVVFWGVPPQGVTLSRRRVTLSRFRVTLSRLRSP